MKFTDTEAASGTSVAGPWEHICTATVTAQGTASKAVERKKMHATRHVMNATLRTARRQASKLNQWLLYEDKAVVVVNKPSGLICQSNKTSGRVGILEFVDVERLLTLV